MAGALKHKERSRYRYHKTKPFIMFARNAYVKEGGLMASGFGGMFSSFKRKMKRNREQRTGQEAET